MKKLAESIAKDATFGNTFLLSGNLGSGKTTFTQFFAKALGVKDIVTSPTYNIVKVYDIPGGEFIHMDAYRLGESGDNGEFDDYIYDDDRIMVIE